MKKVQDILENLSPDGIPSPEQFARILERERERSDRSGQGFSLVLFDVAGFEDDDSPLPALIETLVARRARAVDEIGWFQEWTLGAALPATSAEGAWKFASDIRGGVPASIPPPTCRVFTYPSSWFVSEDGGEAVERGNGRDGAKDGVSLDGKPRTAVLRVGAIAEGMGSLLCRPIPVWKRFLDIVGALFGLVVLSPLFLALAVFIKIVSTGPVFYRQERIGYLGKRFTFWKFRTMHVGNDATIHKEYLQKLIEGDAAMRKLDARRDQRIIPFGRFLRSSCIDELPQLINVLLGDMSLVGPRPCLPYEAERYLQWHARRFDLVPGMTGLWQVSGKNLLSFKEMIRLDIRYSRDRSPWLDAKILFLTGPAILGMVSEPFARVAGFARNGEAFRSHGGGVSREAGAACDENRLAV